MLHLSLGVVRGYIGFEVLEFILRGSNSELLLFSFLMPLSLGFNCYRKNLLTLESEYFLKD